MDDRNSREQRPLLIAEFNLRGKNQKFEMTNIPLSILLRDLLPGLLYTPPSRGRSLRRLASRRRRRRYAWRGASGSSRISDTLRRAFRSYPRSRAEGKGTSARITRPRFLRNLREISLPSQNERFLPRRGGGGGSRTCKLRPREAAIWFLARTFITGDLCCSGATLADGYKLITLVSRPPSRSPFSFFLPIPRECLETRVYAWILPNRYGFLLDSQSYHGKPG